MSKKFEESRLQGIGMWILSIVAIIVVILLASSLISVPAGSKAVVTSGFGIGTIYNEGWNWKNPLQGVENVRYNTQRVEFIGFDTASDNQGNLIVNSKDNIAITIDFQVVFHLDPARVSEIRVQNENFEETVVIPICRSVPRDVCAEFDAITIRGEGREQVSESIRYNITTRLAEKGIVLEEFALQEISLPTEYESAITAKKVAEQNVITQQYNLEAQQYVANQVIVNALAEANVTTIDASAKAIAINTIMNQFHITNQTEASNIYLRWLYIRALTDPNGNVNYIFTNESTVAPIITIPQSNQTNNTANP
jgi:regulator of protease activity HflC (stomatin/prohibitin superfamily)